MHSRWISQYFHQICALINITGSLRPILRRSIYVLCLKKNLMLILHFTKKFVAVHLLWFSAVALRILASYANFHTKKVTGGFQIFTATSRPSWPRKLQSNFALFSPIAGVECFRVWIGYGFNNSEITACRLSHTMEDNKPSDCFRMAASLKLFFTILIAILHRGCFAGVTHPDEIAALKAIADKLGKPDLWNFSVDPCTGGNGSWSTGDDWKQNNVTCNCSPRSGRYCHVTNIKLKTLDLPGVIPPELANLTYLEEIDFTRNYLSGPIPAALGSLTNLRILSVGINRLTGHVPKELGNLSNLESLVIPSNNFSGTLPPELGNLTALKKLHVFTNQFVGEIPSTFANLENMENFRVSSNNFMGRIPVFIANWMNLQALVIQGTSMEGPIPSVIFSHLTQLTDLRISDISQGDSTLSFLQNMAKEKLRTLVLRNNLISGQVPEFIGAFSILKTLDLSFNNLTGPIPNSFKSLRNLEYLFLGSNQLTGKYPFELASNIKNIDLSFNNLSGEISLPLIHGNNVDLIGNFFYTNSTDESRTQSCLRRSSVCHEEYAEYTTLAINCGGPQMNTSAPNIFFEADNESLGVSSFYMSPGGNWAVSSTGYFMDNSSIKNYTRISNAQFNTGLDPRLYMTARLSPISLKYYGLHLYNGQYNVQLHFAETQISDKYTYRSLGLRIFDVYIQGRRVLKDFNTKRNAGDPNAVVIRIFTVNVTENTLEIHFYWAGKGSCCVPYQGVYGPLISAIIISADFEVPKRKHKNVGFIIGMTVAPVLVLVLMIVFFKWRKRRDAKFFQGNGDQEFGSLAGKSNHFNLRELKVATNDFHLNNKIGEGGFGAVYKGMARDGKVVAIKQLSSKSKQGSREFLAEVGTISAVQHPNLVRLYGCCAEGEELLLVYEYMENGNLANALFATEPRVKLDWAARYNICIGVARGLAYLHEESRLRIVHRDIKPTNILLDEHLNPKITDFGLARLFEEEKTHISTRVAGTVGYMAPEYALRGLLTEKADVYSFGVVALEVVSGRRQTDNSLPEEMVYLLEWTWHLYQKKVVLDLIDVKLHSRYSEEEVMRVIRIALLCTHPTPSLRPSMSGVVDMLEGKIETVAPRSGPGYLNHWESLALQLGKNILEEPSTHSRSLGREGPWQGSSSSHRSFAKEESSSFIPERYSDSEED